VDGGITVDGTQSLSQTLYLNDGLLAGAKTNIQITPSLSGNVTSVKGIAIQWPTPGGFSMTDHTGVTVDEVTGSGSGTNKGFEVANIGAAANNHAIYSSAGAKAYFAGNVGIGDTAPGYKLEVAGNVNISTGNAFRVAGTSICTSSGCTISSDRRLKENISPLDDSLEKILQLQGVEYDWKDKRVFSDKHQIGLIAQDVEKVYPEVVVTDSKTGLKAIAYAQLISPIIEAIKFLNDRVAWLFAENDRQAKDIKTLQSDSAEIDARMDRIEKTINSR
jgi:hypothetical protein